jgi:hypothetical protein
MDNDDAEFTVAVRLYGHALVPATVTENIGIVPSFARAKGDKSLTRPSQVPAKIGVWSLEGKARTISLQDQVSELAAKLAGYGKPLLTIPGVEEGHTDLFITGGRVQEGYFFEMTPETLSKLSQIGLPVHITVSA